MRKPPTAVAVIGAIFLALGCLDLNRGLAPMARALPAMHLATDDVLVAVIGLAGLAGGAFLLAGRGWARWLLAAWMGLHVAISLGEQAKLLAHAAIFAVIAFFLFRPRTATYFRGGAG